MEHNSYQQQVLGCDPHCIGESIIIFILHKLLWIRSPDFYLKQRGDKDRAGDKCRIPRGKGSISAPSNLCLAKLLSEFFCQKKLSSSTDFYYILLEKALERRDSLSLF